MRSLLPNVENPARKRRVIPLEEDSEEDSQSEGITGTCVKRVPATADKEADQEGLWLLSIKNSPAIITFNLLFFTIRT